MSGDKTMIGLSWEPKLTLFSSESGANIDSHNNNPLDLPGTSSKIYKPELIDGLYVPPINSKKVNKLLKKQVRDTAGKNWFDMLASTITPELKKDLQIIKLRNVVDPKRHYKKSDSKSKTLPKYCQVGTVVEPASEFFTGRLTKRERKTNLADELLSDQNLNEYRKRKVRQIKDRNHPGGVDKWKIRGKQSRKRGKQSRRWKLYVNPDLRLYHR